MYNKPDVALVNNFIGQFNNYSSTTKLSENINLNTPEDISLEFQPAASILRINTTFGYQYSTDRNLTISLFHRKKPM